MGDVLPVTVRADTLTDEDLIDAWRRGDRAAGDRLLGRLAPSVSAVCRAVCGPRGDAEEAAQEAYLRVIRGLASYRAGAAVAPWVHTIARNAARDVLRRRRPAVALDDVAEPATAVPPDAAFLRAEDARRMAAHIDALPSALREALVVSYGLGHETDVAAGILGISPGALWTRLSRARSELKRRLCDDDRS